MVYWYRPSLKSSVASADPYGQPYVANQDTSRSSYTPSQVLADKIYIITILKSAGMFSERERRGEGRGGEGREGRRMLIVEIRHYPSNKRRKHSYSERPSGS